MSSAFTSAPTRVVCRRAVVERVAGLRGLDVARRGRRRTAAARARRRARRDGEPLEVAEARGPAALVLAPERPHALLVEPLHVAPHLHPPRLHAVAREAELRVAGCASRPSSPASRSSSRPATPGPTTGRDSTCRRRARRPSRRDGLIVNTVRPSVVVVRVEDDLTAVAVARSGRAGRAACARRPRPASRTCARRRRAPRRRTAKRTSVRCVAGLPSSGSLLAEVASPAGRLPRRLVQPPVQHDRRGPRGRMHAARRVRMHGPAGLGERRGRRGGAGQQHQQDHRFAPAADFDRRWAGARAGARARSSRHEVPSVTGSSGSTERRRALLPWPAFAPGWFHCRRSETPLFWGPFSI